MIFMHRARLAILSQPKTGTTALEKSLSLRASMTIHGPPELKHVSYRGFMRDFAPLIESHTGLKRSEYLVVAAMREPLDWLGSWYRYRTRGKLLKKNHPRSHNYTGEISYEEFARQVSSSGADRPSYAEVKTPSWVSLAHRDCIGVDRLFPYEDLSGLYALIEERSGKPPEPDQLNVSPDMELTLSEEALALIRGKFRFDFDLHTSLSKDGMVDERFRVWTDTGEAEDYSSGV